MKNIFSLLLIFNFIFSIVLAQSSGIKWNTVHLTKAGAWAENTVNGTITIAIPGNAYDIEAKTYMLNSPWSEGNCELQPDNQWIESPNGVECSIGWAKAITKSYYDGDTYIYTAYFYNWSDCNARKGMLEVTYKVE